MNLKYLFKFWKFLFSFLFNRISHSQHIIIIIHELILYVPTLHQQIAFSECLLRQLVNMCCHKTLRELYRIIGTPTIIGLRFKDNLTDNFSSAHVYRAVSHFANLTAFHIHRRTPSWLKFLANDGWLCQQQHHNSY